MKRIAFTVFAVVTLTLVFRPLWIADAIGQAFRVYNTVTYLLVGDTFNAKLAWDDVGAIGD